MCPLLGDLENQLHLAAQNNFAGIQGQQHTWEHSMQKIARVAQQSTLLRVGDPCRCGLLAAVPLVEDNGGPTTPGGREKKHR